MRQIKRLTRALIIGVLALTVSWLYQSQGLVNLEKQAEAVVNQEIVITRVVDGDTVEAEINGVKTKIRLIGINTPESVDPRRPVECFGKEASAYTKAKLEGKKVRLESDDTQDDQDKYGRLLRYVYLENGELFNQQVISDGYAKEYTYDSPYKYQLEFKQTEQEARLNKRGLWAEGACKLESEGKK